MICFAHIGDGGPIKIGCSADVPARTGQLATHYRRPMILLVMTYQSRRATKGK